MTIRDIDIIEFLQGNASLDQIESIELWKNSSIDHQREFDLLSLIHSEQPKVNTDLNFIQSDDWDKFAASLDILPKSHWSKSWKFWVAIVALLALLVGGYFSLRSPFIEVDTTSGDYAINQSIPLPDGSIVQLQEHSSIKYRRNFGKKSERVILLTGNAKFDIAHDPNKPFLVDIDDVRVQVLGTIFTITDNPETNTPLITNIEGLIKCYEIDNPTNSQLLERGDQAYWDGKEFDFTPAEIPEPAKPIGENLSIEHIIQYLSSKQYEKIVEFSPYLNVDYNEVIFANKKLDLKDFLQELSINGRVQYSALSNGRYVIYDIRSK